MCYSLAQLKLKAYKQGVNNELSDEQLHNLYEDYLKQYYIEKKEDSQKDFKYYHVNGFDHKPLTVICNETEVIQEMEWGIIPHWSKSAEQAQSIQHKTLNARIETLFEKPSFKEAASKNRCLVMIDSFYEYHLRDQKRIPHRIKRKDGCPLIVAGIWDEWKNPKSLKVQRTVSIVTTQPNSLLTEIHNTGDEARMPLMLDEKNASQWISKNQDEKSIQKLVIKYPSDYLEAYPVKQLKGKNGMGDRPEALLKFDENEWRLF